MRYRLLPPAILVLATTQSPALAGRQDGFSSCIRNMGDCNGDGVCDFAVAGRGHACHSGFGPDHKLPDVVRLVSGKTGELVWEARGLRDEEGFGASISCLTDVDGDGARDLFVRSMMIQSYSIDSPKIRNGRILSGRNGQTLGLPTVWKELDEIGFAGMPAADFDGDGVSDLLMCGWSRLKAEGDFRSECRVLSGKNGSPLLRIEQQPEWHAFGRSLASVGDVNEDGVPDWAIGMIDATRKGQVQICSGKDGAVIRSLTDERDADGLGWSMASWCETTAQPRNFLAIAADVHCVNIYSGDGTSLLGVRKHLTDRDQPNYGGYGAILEWGVVEPEDGQWLLVSSSETNYLGGPIDAIVELVSPDAKTTRTLADISGQALDACFAGDLDGDEINDVAFVTLRDEVLTLQSVRKGVLRRVKLAELRPKSEASEAR